MANLIYIDESPATNQRNGMITIDLRSGDETVSLIMTRYAAGALSRHVACQLLCLDGAVEARTVIAFPAPKKRKKQGVRNA